MIYLWFAVNVKSWERWACHRIQLHIRPLTRTPRPICFAPLLLWRQSQRRERSIIGWLCSLREPLVICNNTPSFKQMEQDTSWSLTHQWEKSKRVLLLRLFPWLLLRGCWSLSHLNYSSRSVKTGCTHTLSLRSIACKAKVFFLLQKQKTSQTNIQMWICQIIPPDENCTPIGLKMVKWLTCDEVDLLNWCRDHVLISETHLIYHVDNICSVFKTPGNHLWEDHL